MIHELLQITGSHNVEGTLIIPKDTGSAQTVTGSVAQQNGEIFIFNGQNWQTLGAQSGITQPDFSLSYLVVAAGGGGGGWGGGGGAGGMLTGSIDTVTSGSSFTMTVGAGGSAGTTGYTGGGDGGASSLAGSGYTTVSTVGGGGGGWYNGNDGRDGGSGGGGGIAESGTNNVTSGGSGTAGQGNDGGRGGGRSGVYYGGGGGGGAGQVGQDHVGQTRGGHGGSGSLSNITGTDTFYAGGGGGHTDRSGNASIRALGGPGGGGDGGIYNNPNRSAEEGDANTGGGGGSATGAGASYDSYSAAGGSGVVIVSYDSSSLSGFGGIRTYNNNKVAHTFQSTGTFTVSDSKTQTDGTLDIFGDSSCTALYQFEDNLNDKGGNYNGTASGTAVSYSQGYINKSMTMGGTDSNIATGIANGHTQTWTFWAFIPNGASGDKILTSLNSSGDGGQGFTYWAGGSGLYLYDIIGGASYNDVTISWSNFNEWRHFAWVKNGTTSIVYENGAQIGTLAAVSGNFQTGNNINLGRGTYGSTLDQLRLDQVRIFNKALSASEVLTVYKE